MSVSNASVPLKQFSPCIKCSEALLLRTWIYLIKDITQSLLGLLHKVNLVQSLIWTRPPKRPCTCTARCWPCTQPLHKAYQGYPLHKVRLFRKSNKYSLYTRLAYTLQRTAQGYKAFAKAYHVLLQSLNMASAHSHPVAYHVCTLYIVQPLHKAYHIQGWPCTAQQGL